MELDGRTLDGAVLETDVCVVGAGPAGLTVARALAGGASDVVLLESGGFSPDRTVQRLNEARTVGDAYAGLAATRHRQIGGTAHLWNTPAGRSRGAKYVPLDVADVAGLSELAWSGWPLTWTELEPWYRPARAACGLLDDEGGMRQTGSDLASLDLTGSALEARIYEIGPADVFTEIAPAAIRGSSNIRLCHHATLCRLRPDRACGRVEEALFATLDGARFAVRADVFVLALGAVENARALLVSSIDAPPAWLRGTREWIGRCFMEHPRDYALTLHPRPGFFEQAGFYDQHLDSLGALVVGRLALAEQVRCRERLPNLSVTLVPRRRRRPWSLGRPRYPRSEVNWSSHYASAAADDRAPHDAFTLLLNLEQPPHRENRVVLASRRDRLAVPAAELHWRWQADDHAGLERTRAAVAREVEAAGLGRVVIGAAVPDPNAHHHAGTTRMSLDPGSGVVDAEGRVHDTVNLYVCGASAFPTAGFANPVLTIVALALRLAAHLEARGTS